MLPRFAKGKFYPKNQEKYIGLKTPTYRSSWEQAFMRLCDEHPNVAKWASESIKIPYRHPFTGKYTVYVPDFFVVYIFILIVFLLLIWYFYFVNLAILFYYKII